MNQKIYNVISKCNQEVVTHLEAIYNILQIKKIEILSF
jgi:hypothetical protein